jgi:hypothetical protein
VPAIVDFSIVPFDRGTNLNISHGPCEVPLDVCFDIAEGEVKAIQRIAFGFNVVRDQIVQTLVLATTLDIARTLKIKKVLPKRLAISGFPTTLDRLDDIDQFLIVIGGDGTLHTQQYYDAQYSAPRKRLKPICCHAIFSFSH